MSHGFSLQPTLRIQTGMEKLSEEQIDTIYGIQYSYYLEVGKCNAGFYGLVTPEASNALLNLFNGMLDLVHSNEIN